MWPPRNVLSRFGGYIAPCEPVEIQTIPSGYAQIIEGSSVVSPISFNQLATTILLPSGGPVPATHSQYIPTYSPSGIVGGGLFGGGAIGYRRAYHGKLVPTVVNGFTVYELAPGEGILK